MRDADHTAAPLPRRKREKLPAEPTPWWGPFCTLAVVWIAGVLAGSWWPVPSHWLMAGAILAVSMVALYWRGVRMVSDAAALLGLMTLAAGWTALSATTTTAGHVSQYIQPQRQLVRVTGQIDSPPRVSREARGAMARFGYRSLSTLYELRVHTITTDQGEVPVKGRLLVREPQLNYSVRQGQQVRLVGWLRGPGDLLNPGQMDFRAWLANRDLAGFLTLPDAQNNPQIDSPEHESTLVKMQAAAGHLAMQSLGRGLERFPSEHALLQTLLLGRRSQGIDGTETAFRRVGLAHILSISGAHLGILMAMLTLGMVVAGVRPWNVVLIVLAVLMFYLLAIPPQVPVVRAAIMTVMLVLAYAMGRRVPRLEPLAIASLIVLIWRPHDLFTPGFQLSFAVVGALICFTSPVARWLGPEPMLVAGPRSLGYTMGRFASGYIAANVVAFIASAPLVMYHFQNISPLTIPLSIITLPLISIVLCMGYLKIAIGVVLPGLGSDIALLLWGVTYVLTQMVKWSASWRISFVELAHGPSVAWTLVAVGLGFAWMAGAFERRKLALTASVLLLAGWLVFLQSGYRTQRSTWPAELGPQVAMRVNFLAVGDGNCYLIRLKQPDGSIYTLMYDCGSRSVDGGLNAILPALRELGVRRIDTLIISHADMDHFNATLDVAWRIPVGRVLLSPQMARSIDEDTARSAPAYLLTQLRNHNLHVEPVSRGWSQTLAGAQWDMLWPAPDFTTPAENDNDLSLVLSIRIAGRRLLLCGDIQELAMRQLLSLGEDLQADVMDLPHHGSFVRGNSLSWLDAVKPIITVQSCGMNRVENDPWASYWPADMTRLRTAEAGMIELDIHHDGTLSWRAFRQGQIQQSVTANTP